MKLSRGASLRGKLDGFQYKRGWTIALRRNSNSDMQRNYTSNMWEVRRVDENNQFEFVGLDPDDYLPCLRVTGQADRFFDIPLSVVRVGEKSVERVFKIRNILPGNDHREDHDPGRGNHAVESHALGAAAT